MTAVILRNPSDEVLATHIHLAIKVESLSVIKKWSVANIQSMNKQKDSIHTVCKRNRQIKSDHLRRSVFKGGGACRCMCQWDKRKMTGGAVSGMSLSC